MTLLFYVDESADHLSHFHAGLLLDGKQAVCAEKALDKVAMRACELGYPKEEVELHGAHIWNGKNDWGELCHEARYYILEAALDVLIAGNIEVIMRGFDLGHWKRKYGSKPPHSYCFMNLLERLNERLEERKERALVIADEHHDKSLMKRTLQLAKVDGTWGYRKQKLDRIVDTVHFIDSQESRLVQLADVVAFTRRRHKLGPQRHPNSVVGLARMVERIRRATPYPVGQFDSVWQAATPVTSRARPG